jgi:hypothetical protein
MMPKTAPYIPTFWKKESRTTEKEITRRYIIEDKRSRVVTKLRERIIIIIIIIVSLNRYNN